MKTLKKTLCLVLALVMAFSLMSVASATNIEKYTDADKVGAAYEEAVDVLLGLGIVNGVSATELAPEGYYTRAQAAKIATYLAVGATVAEMLPAGDSFEDVPAKHWAAKYISYCAEKGILNGVTATTYDPEAYVTGYQFAKMILAAAGYGQNNEFVGSGWAIATAQWALDADNNLFKGDAAAATNDPITRQQAMLIAFNALQNVEFQKYSKDEGTYTDISTDSMGKAKYALNTAVEGLVNKNAANDAAYAKKTQVGTTDYAVVTGADLLNHWVRVYTTGTGADTKTVAVIDLSTVVEVTKATTTAAEWDALFGTADIKNTAGVTVTGMTLNTIAPVGTYILNGVELKAYVAPQTYKATYVKNITTTAGSESIELADAGVLSNTAANDTVVEYAGIAKNDVVYYTVNGGIYNLTKVAAPVEGTITVKDGTKLTVNGTVYEASTIADTAAITNDLWNGTTLSTVNFKDTYKLYLDNAGKYFAIVKVTNAAVQSDIVYTVATFTETTTDAYGTPSTKNYAQTVDLNGVEGKVLVTTASTGFGTYALSTVEAEAKAGIMVQSAAPSSYATTTPIFETDAVGGALTTKSTSMSTDAGKAYITAESNFIFIDGSKASMKVEVVTGGVNFTIPADASVLLTKDADGNYIVKTVIINGKYTNAGVNAADYLYVADAQAAPAQTADGYVFTVYAAATGEKMTITASNTTLDNAFYSYKVVDGVYTLTKDTSNTNLILGADYTSKFGTKITATSVGADVEAGSAIIVDTRTAAEITSSKVAALTSIDAIHAAENATTGAVNVAFDVVVGTDGIVAIYVTGTSAK